MKQILFNFFKQNISNKKNMYRKPTRTKKNKIILYSIFFFGALVLSISLSGCCTNDLNNINVFSTYISTEPSNLDPARGVDVNEAVIQSRIFDGLVRYNEKMELVPDLAESWTVSEDGCEFIFNLRKDVIFHNGQEFTAEDVVFSLDRILDPNTASPRTWVLEKIAGASERMKGESEKTSGINALDKYRVSIRLNEPFAPFMSLLTTPACYILPSKSKDTFKSSDFFDKPVGTGPFFVKDRVRDSYIHLAVNEKYFLGKPKVDNMLVRIIPENLKAELEFECDSIDLLQLYPSNFNRFRDNEKYKNRIVNVPALNVWYIGFNNQAEPFNNVKIRKALNLLIDREKIIEAIYSGRAVPAIGSIPPGISGYNSADTGIGFKPEEGLKLLAEAGYNKDNPLKFELYQKNQQSAFEITRFIQGELKKYNVIIETKPMEWSALKDAINKGEAKAFFMNWFGDYPDGENFLNPLFHSKNWGSGGNRAKFKNDEVDALIEEAVKITDENLRSQAYDKINRKVVEQAPWLYLWHCSETYVTSPRVKNIDFYPMFFCDKGLNIELKTEN